MGFTGLSRDGTAIAAEHKNKNKFKKNRRRSERGFSNQPGSSQDASKKEMDIQDLGRLLNRAWKLKKKFL